MIGPQSSDAEVAELIAQRYGAGGHNMGWMYIYGRLASRVQPEIITIGLNPGGGRGEAYDWKSDADLAQDKTIPKVINTYFDQPWGAKETFTPLQRQIQLIRERYFPATELGNILSFQFIPFRSPTWSELPSGSYADAIDLGSELLDWTLAGINKPRLVLGFGLSAVAERIVDWFSAKHEFSTSTGWGKTLAHVYSTPMAGRLVLLPHLSRYRVIGRPSFVDEARVFEGALP